MSAIEQFFTASARPSNAGENTVSMATVSSDKIWMRLARNPGGRLALSSSKYRSNGIGLRTDLYRHYRNRNYLGKILNSPRIKGYIIKRKSNVLSWDWFLQTDLLENVPWRTRDENLNVCVFACFNMPLQTGPSRRWNITINEYL